MSFCLYERQHACVWNVLFVETCLSKPEEWDTPVIEML